MMDRTYLDGIARAVLYEGYVLYPYRQSSLKNSKRWMFGTLYPETWAAAQRGSDRSHFQLECILEASKGAGVSALVRFLYAGAEQEVSFDLELDKILCAAHHERFAIAEDPGVTGEITARAVCVGTDVFKLTLIVRNTTELGIADREGALMRSLASTHAALIASEAHFVSMTDPPPSLKDAASGCANSGVWPVLIGAPGSTGMILASPIILPDYPQLAPESPGDLCDATEIDEILSLRILTLTDDEKAEVLQSGDQARKILERTEMLPREHLMRLHGTMRKLAPAESEPWSAWDSVTNCAPVETIRVGGIDLKKGDRVRLRPAKRADIFDSALEGRVAVIASIEQDFENTLHVAVVVEDDPGRDLGEMRQIGHRFFFSLSEIEPLAREPGITEMQQ
jgi:hypothetical protein